MTVISKSVQRRLAVQSKAPIFAVQATKFLAGAVDRKRNPIRSKTLRTYKSQIETHLLPVIGSLPLDAVGNAVVKPIVASMHDAGLSATTIQINIFLVKQIRASAVNQDGEELYPYKWNNDFLDLPSVENQKQPTVTPELIQEAIRQANPTDKALYAILAGTGLRISEALAILTGPDDGVGTVWSPSERKIIVRQQRDGDTFGPTKTKAGAREVDLSPELNSFLCSYPTGTVALMFSESLSTYRARLEQNGISGGFHAFRRFRGTHMEKCNVSEMLRKFWTGHAAKDVTERYIKFGEEIEARKRIAAQIGLGFNLETPVAQ